MRAELVSSRERQLARHANDYARALESLKEQHAAVELAIKRRYEDI